MRDINYAKDLKDLTMNRLIPWLMAVAFGCVLAACTNQKDVIGMDIGLADASLESNPTSDAASDDVNTPADAEVGPRILSAFHGLDALPDRASLICPTMVGGTDGIPVVFSVQLDITSIVETAFRVERADGGRVTPLCASLAPALEPLELRTVLLAGNFGSDSAPPRAIEVVGPIYDLDGNDLTGLQTNTVIPLESGPELVLAERFTPDTPGLVGECPADTLQVIQLTWNGGVHSIGHATLGDEERLGTTVTLVDGSLVHPIALADDDPDNHILACLNSDIPARSVRIAAGLFEDPGADPNDETQIFIND